MKRLIKLNKRGFMISEQLLIVLMISTFFLLAPVINKNICETKIDYFLKSLKSDINYAMHYSMTNYNIVKIRFKPNDYVYDLSINGYSVFLKDYKYDRSLVINSYIVKNIIDVTHGNVVNSHYFYLSCGNIKYKINIYEKSGIINATKQ
ncbi:MAG: hypothetical protein K0Q49_1779 [Haloplasmataceae bacterium]|jgi:hypothetical protein|nr:hypothetical protein [Haloplasmataceae bacterium]